MAKLWMLEKNGRFSTRKVKLVRVYDPAFVSAGDTARLRFDDLGGTGNAKALQFEGHIEMDGRSTFLTGGQEQRSKILFQNVVRQAHHERNESCSAHPELVEGRPPWSKVGSEIVTKSDTDPQRCNSIVMNVVYQGVG